MIMSDGEIMDALRNGEIGIDHLGDLKIGPCSVDLHLDNKAMILDDSKMFEGEAMEFGNPAQSTDKFTPYNGWESITIHPNEFYILSSKEKIVLDKKTAAFVCGRSSMGRIGLNVHVAGVVDAGFSGVLSIIVTNFTKYPIILKAGTRVAQIVFFKTGKEALVGYGEKTDSKYNNQSGPSAVKV